MRKVITSTLVLILVSLFIFASAEGLDYTNLSDAELQAIISAATEELNSRHASDTSTDGALHMVEGTVLLDQNNITVTLTGNIESYGSSESAFMELEAIVENNSSDPIYVNVDSSSINGWEVFGAGIADIGAGKKKKGTFTFMISDAEISKPEDIEELEVSFSISNVDNWNTIFRTDTVILVP